MRRAAYLLTMLQKRLKRRFFLQMFATGAGSVYRSDDTILFTFKDEEEFFDEIKKHLENEQ